jgi:hypothetical protein
MACCSEEEGLLEMGKDREVLVVIVTFHCCHS